MEIQQPLSLWRPSTPFFLGVSYTAQSKDYVFEVRVVCDCWWWWKVKVQFERRRSSIWAKESTINLAIGNQSRLQARGYLGGKVLLQDANGWRVRAVIVSFSFNCGTHLGRRSLTKKWEEEKGSFVIKAEKRHWKRAVSVSVKIISFRIFNLVDWLLRASERCRYISLPHSLSCVRRGIDGDLSLSFSLLATHNCVKHIQPCLWDGGWPFSSS